MPEGKSPGDTRLPITAVVKTERITRQDKSVCKHRDVSCARHKVTVLFYGPVKQPPVVFCQSQIVTLEATFIYFLP